MTADILITLADAARKRVEASKKTVSEEEMEKQARALPCATGFPFERALRPAGMSFICECKRASPSKGMISEDFPYLEIAKEYEAAGASAISVLTEPTQFLGKDEYLREIAFNVSLPCIRKDFVVDPYMIYEAKCLGASAVLLICSILNEEQLGEYIAIANSLGMSALVETHDKDELEMATKTGARLIGVNNRNLRDFTVDINTCIELRPLAPSDCLFVAESGISTREDIAALEKAGVDAVLIGETLMRSEDKRSKLDELRGLK
ncbi:MAG: indole-3-glycerol phosphate synthase TrpC [Thermoplasmata archaeon]|nr:indole-3-glycerol phosphate synthase TrpC [Thermoplasmata archaeon]